MPDDAWRGPAGRGGSEAQEDADQREALRPRALVGHLFRFTSPRYRDFAQTAAMSKAYPQRFNTPVLGAVYLSREPDTAAAEALRRIARDTRLVGSADLAAAFDRVMPRSIFVVQVRLRAVLGLSTRVALDAWGLRADSLAADDFAPCQEVATLAAKNGAEGVRWASATGAGESVALFWDQRHAGSHVDLVDEFPVERHWFEDIVNGTPVSHFLPALHDYPRYALDSASHP